MTFLADTSAWTNVHKSEATMSTWRAVMRAGEVRSTAPVRLELLRGARNHVEFRRYLTAFTALEDVDIAAPQWARALDVQGELARLGTHRGVSLVDLIIAAAAESADVTVLHYDGDFDRIAEITGQRTEWIAPRGSL